MTAITKRQVGTILRRLGKKLNFDYYSGFTCCNSCFTAELPENKPYVYMKHGLKGMNYTSSKQFNEQNDWYLAYDLPDYMKVFKAFKQEAEKIGKTKVMIPESSSKCLAIIRNGDEKK